MKYILLFLGGLMIFSSCERYDEDVIEISGLYDATVLGISGPHTISVAYDRGDNISIEAPFDGVQWAIIRADVDHQQDRIKRIDIFEQEIGPGVFIWGEGSYFEGTLQLDYTIDYGIGLSDFRILGNQFF